MSWVSFIIGGMTVIFVYALFSDDNEEIEMDQEDMATGNVAINDFSGRHVTLSCQTCRKLKRHKEVQLNLYQCTKCKRQVDLRAS